jgi:hypothetical protein
MRTSEVLRDILARNPGLKRFSVRRILASIGHDRFEASLMMFSIPALVPVPGPRGITALPTGAIACQLASGHKQITLPAYILRKTVSRRALAVAIHAVLPVLEAAERIMRPRWSWVSHAISRRVLGMFVLLLAIALAFPLFGFNAFHATSIFVISLGMAEQDGLAVMIGVVAGVLSIAIVAATGVSARALRFKVGKWLRKIARKLGITVFARFLSRIGYGWLANILTFEWSELLLMWDPERRAAERAESTTAAPARSSLPREETSLSVSVQAALAPAALAG